MKIYKIMLLISFGIIRRYWGETFPNVFKIFEPVMLTYNGIWPLTICGILIGLSYVYLLITAIYNYRKNEKFLITAIILMFNISVAMDFYQFSEFTPGQKSYFLWTSSAFFIVSACTLIKIYKPIKQLSEEE